MEFHPKQDSKSCLHTLQINNSYHLSSSVHHQNYDVLRKEENEIQGVLSYPKLRQRLENRNI